MRPQFERERNHGVCESAVQGSLATHPSANLISCFKLRPSTSNGSAKQRAEAVP